MTQYDISSNKRPRRTYLILSVEVRRLLEGTLKTGRRLFQSKRNYSCEISSEQLFMPNFKAF